MENNQNYKERPFEPNTGRENTKSTYHSYAQVGTKPPRKSNLWILFVVLAIVVGGGLFIIGITLGTFIGFLGNDSSSSISTINVNAEYIGVLYIEGAISSSDNGSGGYSHSYYMTTVEDMTYDNKNKGMFLYIDSPGGEVYATDELYLAIMNYKEITGRPVYAYCASLAASGGYYLAAAADEILINRNGMTGSIGVIAGTVIDVSGFLEKNGIKTTSIYVGENKAMGSNYETFTQEQKEIYLSVLEETYDQFVDVIAASRKMSPERVETLADGRIYSAKQALKNNLVDGISTYEEALEKMIEKHELSDYEVVDFFPVASLNFTDLLGVFQNLKKTEVEMYLENLQLPVKGPAYYYQSPN